MIVLIFLILCSFSIFLLFKYDKKIEETLPYTFIGIVIFLFLMGLIKLLRIGVYIIVFLSLLAVIYSIIKFIKSKEKKEILLKIFSPGYVIFIISFIFICIYHHGRLLNGWDEFTHWGDVVKMMYTMNDYSTNPASLSAASTYLPGISLFQYFWQVLLGSYTEGYLYVSSQVLFMSFLLPFTKDFKWNQPVKIIISLITYIIFPIIMYLPFYKSIYVDCILGVIFGFNLATIYLNRNTFNKEAVLKISLSLIMLSLAKDIGIVLGFICLYIVFVFVIISEIKKKKFSIKDFYPLIIFIIANFLFYFLWQLKISIDSNALSTTLTDTPNLEFVINSLLGIGDLYGTGVRDAFFEKCTQYPIIGGFLKLDSVTILLLLLCLFIFIYKNEGKKDVLAISWIVNVIIGVIGYLFLLLVLYLWKFGEYEAVRLASWNRYAATIFIGALYSLMVIIIAEPVPKKRIINTNLIIIFVIVCLGTSPADIQSYLHRGISETISFREYFDATKDIITSKIGDKKAAIYFISQKSLGMDYWVFKYTNRENLNKINKNFSWSLGEKYYYGDVWTLNITPEDWMNNLINDYEYVYLFHIDEKFIDRYGDLFFDKTTITDNSLYKIDKTNKKLVKL